MTRTPASPLRVLVLAACTLLFVACSGPGSNPAGEAVVPAPAPEQPAQDPAQESLDESLPEAVGLPNPASAYCTELGGRSQPMQDEDGGAYAVCQLPDGTVIEEWELYRRDHPAEE